MLTSLNLHYSAELCSNVTATSCPKEGEEVERKEEEGAKGGRRNGGNSENGSGRK